VATASAENLVYDGGIDGVGVTTGVPRVYLVFWGTQWGSEGTNSHGDATFTGDPAGVAPDLEAFLKGLGTGGETWSGVMTQYCQAATVGSQDCTSADPHVGYSTGGAFAGLWADETATAPPMASGYEIGAEAVRAAKHFGNTTPASNRYTQYVVVSPTGTNPDGYKSGSFCAWHDYTGDTSLGSSGVPSNYGALAFTNLPYLPDAGAGCGEDFVNADGPLDGVTIVEGHEFAETITDQFPQGGWIAGGNEAADKCAWIVSGQGAAQDITLTTGTFAVQSIWANDFNAGAGGCEVSHPVVTGRNSAPDAPALVWASPRDGAATVNWTAPPSDGGSTILKYTVTATDTTTPAKGGETCSWTSGPFSCTMSGLTDGNAVTFAATATNALGTGPASTPSSPVRPAHVPGAPTRVTATPGNGSASVGWSAPTSNGGSAINQYTATASPGGQSCAAASHACAIEGLRTSTAYTFSVVAWNAVGAGARSAESPLLYPFHPKGFAVEVTAVILSTNLPFTAIAGGAAPGSTVLMTLPNAAPARCRAGGTGQCVVQMREPKNGVFRLHASLRAAVKSLALYVPSLTGPAEVKRGGTITISVSHCPRAALVSLALSDGRRVAQKSTSSGTAVFHLKMPTVTKEKVTATVDRTALARVLLVSVT